MDKVASSPALATAEGWPVEESPALSENEVAALGVALGVGMSVIANAEDTPERHTLADLANLDPATLPLPVPQLDTCSDVGEPPGLLPHQDTVGVTTQHGEDNDSINQENKMASFYIGDELGCTRDLPAVTPEVPMAMPDARPAPRRVQIQETNEKRPTVEFTPPDGGYGWVVAAAACFVNMWIVGFIKSYGVMYVPIMNAFPGTSAYQASWLPALLATLGLIIAPVTGVLCRCFTSRKVTFIGGLFCCLGLLLGSQAATMNQLILSTGILTGVGAGLTTTPSVLIVSLYFEKRRALASAICVSGNALGGFILPPLVDLLLKVYGLQGTMMILAAMQLHICAASMLYRPIRLHALIQAREGAKTLDVEDGVPAPLEHNKLLPQPPASPHPSTRPTTTTSAPNTPLSRPHAIWQKVVRRRLTSASTTEADEELQRQVSFLRSSSMMNSIPDLTHYARSWSVSYDRTSLGSRSSSIRLALGSKSSLSRDSLRAVSKLSLNRLQMTNEPRHQPLVRLPSDGEDRCVRHPTLVRLASEEEGRPSRVIASATRRRSHPRVTPLTDGRVSRQASARSLESRVQRQPSTRRVQSRIMDAVKELDTDSQDIDEIEEGQENILYRSDSTKSRVSSNECRPKSCEVSEVKPVIESRPKSCEVTCTDSLDTREPTFDVAMVESPREILTIEECKAKINLDEEELIVVVKKRPNCCTSFFTSCIDVTLFSNPLFMMMALSVFFMAAGAPHAIFFLPAYADSVDIPSSQIPHMLSILSIVDLCGRLGIGFISDLNLCRNSHLYFVSTLASGVATLLIPRMTTFASLSAILGLYGYGVGSWFVLIPTILAQHHGANRLASSYGVVRLFHGLMNFTSPQISGLMIDSSGQFRSCYFFMGTCMALAAALVLPEPVLLRYSKKAKEKYQVHEQVTKAQA